MDVWIDGQVVDAQTVGWMNEDGCVDRRAGSRCTDSGWLDEDGCVDRWMGG